MSQKVSPEEVFEALLEKKGHEHVAIETMRIMDALDQLEPDPRVLAVCLGSQVESYDSMLALVALLMYGASVQLSAKAEEQKAGVN